MSLMQPFFMKPLGFFSRMISAFRMVFSKVSVFLLLPLLLVGIDYLLSHFFDHFVVGLQLSTYEYGSIPFAKLAQLIPVMILAFGIALAFAGIIIMAQTYVLHRFDHNKSPSFFEAFSLGVKRLGAYFSYLFHMLLYIYLVPVVIGVIAYLVIAAQNWIPSAYWVDALDYIGETFLAPGFLLIVFVFILFRGPQIVFAPYLIIDEALSGKQAVKRSIALVGRKGVIKMLFTVALWIAVLLGLWALIAFVAMQFADVPYTFQSLMIKYAQPFSQAGIFELLFGQFGIFADVLIEVFFASVSVIFFFLYMRTFQASHTGK